MRNRRGSAETTAIFGLATIGVILIIGVLLWGLPTYRVWQLEMSGKAQLAEAEWNRQIAVREAQAQLESAVHLADAEVARARGVAEANDIIAEGLGGPQGYLSYLWVQALQEGEHDVIYVPTESQLPMLEAGRLGERQ
jgi:hypothetical protein